MQSFSVTSKFRIAKFVLNGLETSFYGVVQSVLDKHFKVKDGFAVCIELYNYSVIPSSYVLLCVV